MDIQWNFILRIFIAGLLGGLIGFEREFRAKEAGVRTHFIVALGSALFMIISQFAFEGRYDAARVAAQVVSGIGFIGAGVIIFQRNVVRGVTTAAGLWVAAAIGLGCGAGMYDVTVFATILTIICLEAMHFITKNYGERSISMTVSPIKSGDVEALLDSISECGEVHSFALDGGVLSLNLVVKTRHYTKSVGRLLTAAADYTVEIN